MVYILSYQLYASFDIPSVQDELLSKSKIESCITDIKSWMTINKLKLNDDKTEVIIITSPYNKSRHTISNIQVGDSYIDGSTHARNIGVMFDEVIDMHQHIANICKSSTFHLRQIRAIKKYLTREAVEKLVHAFVTSRLDANNALLYGLPFSTIRPLQLILNMAAKVIVGARKYDHVTPLLKSLHWLPIQSRIIYKVVLLTFKALHGLAPKYLSDLLEVYTPSRSLRSSTSNLLTSAQSRTKAGDRAFKSAAPILWNGLPATLRSLDSLNKFKSALKTHLFNKYY